jgi:hypothetical protein
VLTLGNTDNLAAKQDAGTDVLFNVNGDDVTLSTKADDYKCFGQGALSTTATALFSSPASDHGFLIDSIKFTNTGSLLRTITVYFDKGGTTYDATTQWGTAIILAAGESAEWGGSGWIIYDSTGQPRVALGGTPTKVVHIFSGTTTYTPTVGVRALYVECIGGGGGGGGVLDAATNSGAGGGGGGGAYSAVYTTTIKASFVCAIGAGGTGGAAGANNGAVGGDTTFDSASICTAKGGLGGIADTVTTIHIGGLGGNGGPRSTGVGDLLIDGSPGSVGISLAAAEAHSGKGGASALGGGANGRDNQGDGITATGYGGGGSGGNNLSSVASQAGGTGAPGVIRVWELP